MIASTRRAMAMSRAASDLPKCPAMALRLGLMKHLVSIILAVTFSLFYICLYPVFRREFVIYAYPPWSVAQATIYILGGILVQGWFCFRQVRSAAVDMPVAQGVTGVLYAAAAVVLSGGDIYQS